MAIAQAEGVDHGGIGGRVHADDFALAEVIAAAVAAEPGDFFGEVAQRSVGEVFRQAVAQRVGRAVVAGVEAVFAAGDPLFRHAERGADFGRGTFGDGLGADIDRDATALFHRALAAAGAGRQALADGFDQRSANFLIRHGVGRQIELQQAHGALDVHAYGAGIDVRWRHQHATHGRAIADVGIGIQHNLRHAGCRRRC